MKHPRPVPLPGCGRASGTPAIRVEGEHHESANPRPVPARLNDASLFQQQIDVLSAVASTDVADLTQAETIADAARSVLDLAPKEPFVLVGLSLGGYVAFEIMRQAPERVAALALLDTSARPESPEARAARTALMTLAETDLKAVFEQLMPRLSHPDRMNQPAVRGVVHSMMSSLGKGIFLRQQRMIMTRPDSRPSLADIRCPTLVICGREDLITRCRSPRRSPPEFRIRGCASSRTAGTSRPSTSRTKWPPAAGVDHTPPPLSRREPSAQRLGQQHRHVHRLAAGSVLDLMPAREAVGDDWGVVGGGTHGRQQGQLSHFHRRLVMLGLQPEAAGHAAATGVHDLELESGIQPSTFFIDFIAPKAFWWQWPCTTALPPGIGFKSSFSPLLPSRIRNSSNRKACPSWPTSGPRDRL
jgi:pimeloyl-ACP methyl ester carboxylesterase